MHTILISLVLCGLPDVPTSGLYQDNIDLMEFNHYCNEKNEMVFTQIIFWRYLSNGKKEVIAWRLWKRDDRPRKCYKTGCYYIIWHDDSKLRRVTSKHLIETWTQKDPEGANRSQLPEEERIGLRETP